MSLRPYGQTLTNVDAFWTNRPVMKKRRWIVWVILFFVWLFIGLSFSLNDYKFRDMLREYYAGSPSLLSIIGWDLVYWPLWAAFTPFILLLARRFPIRQNSWHRNLLINLIAWLTLPILQRLVYASIAWTLQQASGDKTPFSELLPYNLPLGLLICGVILFVSHTIDYFREEELQAERLKTNLIQAQLAALKMQLQPHFLFNTLSYISAQLGEDVNAADKMLAQLGDFFRITLKNSGDQEVTVEAELELLSCYLDILKVRTGDRLQVSYQLDQQTLCAQVPNFILQPIIENAVQHGLGQSLNEVQIIVSAKQENQKLCLVIKDNGENWEAGDTKLKEGVGISLTRARLKTAYGSDAQFDLTRTPDGWTMAALAMPLIIEGMDGPLNLTT